MADLVPENIGNGLKTTDENDKILFIKKAQEAIEDCRYYLLLVRDLEYINNFIYDNISRLLFQLREISNIYKSYISSLIEHDL